MIMRVIHILSYVTLMCVIRTSAVHTTSRTTTFEIKSENETAIIMSAEDHNTTLHRMRTICVPQLVIYKVNDTRTYNLLREFIYKRVNVTLPQNGLSKAVCPKPTAAKVAHIIFLIALGCFVILAALFLATMFIHHVFRQRLGCCR